MIYCKYRGPHLTSKSHLQFVKNFNQLRIVSRNIMHYKCLLCVPGNFGSFRAIMRPFHQVSVGKTIILILLNWFEYSVVYFEDIFDHYLFRNSNDTCRSFFSSLLPDIRDSLFKGNDFETVWNDKIISFVLLLSNKRAKQTNILASFTCKCSLNFKTERTLT